MFFRQFSSQHGSLSYLLGCGSQGKAMAVDVVEGEEDKFIRAAAEQQVVITHVVDTHLHADHVSGGRQLAARVGADYALHETAQTAFPYQGLQEGQRIALGNVEVEVRHTPGHTVDSISLVVTDQRRAAQPWFVLTGDTLLVGAVGRPDLAGREREMAALLFDSLHNKLLPLADVVEVYPGHQSGSLCGAGLSGKPSSTLGFERCFNPALQQRERSAFVEFVLQAIPAKPQTMAQILAANSQA